MDIDQIALWVGYGCIFVSAFCALAWVALDVLAKAVRNYMHVPRLFATIFVISKIKAEVRKGTEPEEIKRRLWGTWVGCVDDIIQKPTIED
jgi:hypothetical protein